MYSFQSHSATSSLPLPSLPRVRALLYPLADAVNAPIFFPVNGYKTKQIQ